MVRYRCRRRLRELANERRRFGYRRLFILLRREGEPSGINRIHRLYREEGLAVGKRRARRKAIGVRVPILLEARPNARWSLDFVYNQFANGRRFRVLNIVDDVTKECLGVLTAHLAPSRRSAHGGYSVRRDNPGAVSGPRASGAAIFWASKSAASYVRRAVTDMSNASLIVDTGSSSK
jgi:putative transposase